MILDFKGDHFSSFGRAVYLDVERDLVTRQDLISAPSISVVHAHGRFVRAADILSTHPER